MPSLNELKLSTKPLKDEVPDFDSIPAERGAFVPPPDPGSYRFALPKVINNFDVVQSEKHGERINVIFGAEAPLVIEQSPGKAFDGQTFETRVSNVPRPRGREKVLVSDMDYLLRAKGATKRPANNAEYGKAVQALAGQSIGADVEWAWNCSDRRAARFDDGQGGLQKVEDPESTLQGDDAGFKAGCGARYYMSDVGKVEGKYPLTITCANEQCGASVRAFPQLSNFKP